MPLLSHFLLQKDLKSFIIQLLKDAFLCLLWEDDAEVLLIGLHKNLLLDVLVGIELDLVVLRLLPEELLLQHHISLGLKGEQVLLEGVLDSHLGDSVWIVASDDILDSIVAPKLLVFHLDVRLSTGFHADKSLFRTSDVEGIKRNPVVVVKGHLGSRVIPVPLDVVLDLGLHVEDTHVVKTRSVLDSFLNDSMASQVVVLETLSLVDDTPGTHALTQIGHLLLHNLVDCGWNRRGLAHSDSEVR